MIALIMGMKNDCRLALCSEITSEMHYFLPKPLFNKQIQEQLGCKALLEKGSAFFLTEAIGEGGHPSVFTHSASFLMPSHSCWP